MNKSFGAASLLALAVSLTSSCSSNTPQKQLYTLHSQNTATAAPVALEGSLGVGPIELPESFRGDAVVIADADRQILISQSHQWAGDFKKNISRTIAANLSQQLGYDDVWPYPWDTRHRPQKQISLFIEQLHGQLGQPVTMVVKWILFNDQGNEVASVAREEFTSTPANDSYASYVAAINDLINQCSRRLGVAVREQWVKS